MTQRGVRHSPSVGLDLRNRSTSSSNVERCILRCMSTRTQIYLTDDQRRRIKEVAAAEGVSMAEVVRPALDGYLDDQTEPDKALAATFGALKDLAVPSRDEWERG